MWLAQVIRECHLPCTMVYPSEPSRVNTVWITKFKAFLSFFVQRPLNVVYQSSHVMSWATERWILTYCLPSLYCPSLAAYTYFPTFTSGYFPPLMYFRTSRLGYLLFHGDFLILLEYPSIPCTIFISTFTTLPTAISLLSFFAMDRVTRQIFSVWLLVPCRPVLLDPIKVLTGAIWCDRVRNKLWGGSATASLNIISCRVLTLCWSI